MNPKPTPQLLPPHVDPEFCTSSMLFRIYETLRFTLLSFEYRLSHDASLREFLFRCVYLWLLVGIPVLLFLPLIDFASNTVLSIAMNLAESLTQLILPVSLALIALFIITWLFKR